MKSRQCWKRIAGALAAACLLFSGCGSSGSSTKVTVALNATILNLLVNQTFLFQATVSGATDTSVTYMLTSVPTPPVGTTNPPAGTPTACSPGCGTLTGADKTSVTYTAPATVPNPAQTITLTATATADNRATAKAAITVSSGITVTVKPGTATIGLLETFKFQAVLTNDPTPNDVNWTVKETNAGTVDATGLYSAPAAVPNPATATVVATSKLDPNQSGSATVTIVTAAASAFTGITPAVAPRGGIFQDIYLLATNVRSTSTVTFNGSPVTTDQVKVVNASLVRLRLNDAQLGLLPGPYRIQILNATETGGPFNVQIESVRPGLIATILDSTLQNANSGQLMINGGFFGPSSSPVVSARFNGDNPHVIASSNSREITMNLASGDVGVPGLYSVSALNNAVAGLEAAGNFAVQPEPIANPPALAGAPISLKSSPADTPGPTAIAIDTTLGIAIVANRGNNTVQRLKFTGLVLGLLGPQIALPGSPTGVGVDEERHIAAVAVSSAKSVKIVDLNTGSILGTVDVSSVTTQLPFSVGLDPTTGLGIVAFSRANIGAIFNADGAAAPTCLFGTAPYCVTGVMTLGTGDSPQIAMHPRLRWAYVTPGGTTGLMNVVDLGVPQHQAAIAAPPSGASRKNNVVTIVTTTNHNLNAVNPGTVLISGVADGSFNGSFAVTSVIDSKTFTYSQIAADATSGGGSVAFSNSLLTFTISSSISGIAINRQTGKAIIADPGSNFPSILSTQDQTSVSINVQHPTTGAGFQPFTNVAVVVKPGSVGAAGVDTITLLDPTDTSHVSGPPQGVLAEINTGGSGSGAVAVDPPTNTALVVNSLSHDLSVISLSTNPAGVVRTPQISEVRIPLARRLFSQGTSFSSTTPAADLPVKIFGAFVVAQPAQVRLDGQMVATVLPNVNGREIDVTIPAASFLTAPRAFALDVVQGGIFSNVTDFTVVESVDLTSACTTGPPQPSAVAVDDTLDLAVVANIGCNNISIIELNTGHLRPSIAVGTAPAGVAVIPRLGLAVVANSNVNLSTGAANGAGTVSIVDLAANTVKSSPGVGTIPLGVAINQDTGRAYVVNSASNTLSAIDLTVAPATVTTGATDQQPISIAIDPDRQVAVVGALNVTATLTTGLLDVIDISSSTGAVGAIKNKIGASSLPTGVVFDPVNTQFYAVSSLNNLFLNVNPDVVGTAPIVRVGVNPTSLAYNYHTGTLVTVNSASNTISFVDAQSLQTRETIGLGTPPLAAPLSNPQFAVAIHPRMNLAVVSDSSNNRVLFLPMHR
jgi:DNA-binding beta-propeller fold protein YncE